MFSHILVPIDGSAHSQKAAEVAVDFATAHDAQVTFLHVTRKFEIPEPLRRYVKREHITGEQLYEVDDATEKMIKEVQRDARESGVKKSRTKVVEGKPSRTIVEFARKEKCDAIFMGSRGLTDIEAALLGSVSHKVASLASCTVVLVR